MNKRAWERLKRQIILRRDILEKREHLSAVYLLDDLLFEISLIEREEKQQKSAHTANCRPLVPRQKKAKGLNPVITRKELAACGVYRAANDGFNDHG